MQSYQFASIYSMGNIVNTVKRFSSSAAGAIPFQRCSYLSSDTSSLEKCPCVDNDSSMIGNIASATKGSIIGSEAFSKEIGNEEMHLYTGSTSRIGCHGDINCSALPMADTDPAVYDEANREIETQNGTTHRDAREHGCVDHSDKTGLIYRQTADHTVQSLEDENPETPRSLTLEISGDILNKVSPAENCSTNPDLADDSENGPAIDARKSKELSLHRVSPSHSLCNRNISQDLIDCVLNFGCESTPEASLKVVKHKKRTQNKSVKGDIVPIEIRPACATSDVRSFGSTPKTSLKGRGNRKKTTTKASNQMLVPKENIRTSIPSDVICLENVKQATNPLVEQTSAGKVLCSTSKPRMTKTPLSYVRQSPLTRSKAKAWSISTPESLKMKRTRSGRLIVPRLDPGSQNIIYGPDGFILGIGNMEVQCPQGSNSESPSKMRRFRRLSPDHNRLLTF